MLRRWLARNAAGAELIEDRLLPARGHVWLALYAVASTVYRVMVVVLILWFLHKVLGPYGLDPLVQLIGLAAVGAMVGDADRRRGSLSCGIRIGATKCIGADWRRSVLLTLLVLALLLCIPLPHRVAAPVVLEPVGADGFTSTCPERWSSRW